jgi:hypothetical protein
LLNSPRTIKSPERKEPFGIEVVYATYAAATTQRLSAVPPNGKSLK